MKLDLESILKALGWPVALIAVFSAVLAFFGVDLNTVMTIATTMVGAQALISLLVDVLKWAGVVQDGDAGKWSAGLNLLGIGGIAAGLVLQPDFNFPALDAQLMVIAQFLALIFGYIVQVAGAKHLHKLYANGLGIQAFSHAAAG